MSWNRPELIWERNSIEVIKKKSHNLPAGQENIILEESKVNGHLYREMENK